MPTGPTEATEHILPLNMNDLSGRMLRLPAPKRKKREILLIAGHHTSVERMAGFGEYLNQFGGVTLPDLPGFGGMEPFYKIGVTPTVDNLADYLATFIKLRYKNRRFSIMAISFGFTVVTRMLQKYPEIATKVDLVVSVAGFVHKDDFRWKRRNIALLRSLCRLLSYRLTSAAVRILMLNGPFIRSAYRVGESTKFQHKLKDADKEERRRRIDFEITLWKINDIRTYMYTATSMLKVDLGGQGFIDLPVYHVGVENDHYFDNLLVESHMRAIYRDFQFIKTDLPTHAPTILATAKDIEPLVPPKIRSLLRKKA